MKPNHLTQAALSAKTSQEILEIADKLHLTITEEMSDEQVIHLILDYQEAESEEVTEDEEFLEDTPKSPSRISSFVDRLLNRPMDEEEEVIAVVRKKLRKLTPEECQALKMKRLTMPGDSSMFVRIMRPILFIDELIEERKQFLCQKACLMEEGY